MGVLRRSARPKSVLVSKNPTGLPMNQPEVDQAPSASLLAAQAAALSFKSNTELPTTQKTVEKSTISRSGSTKRLSSSSFQQPPSRSNVRSAPTIRLENLSISDAENDKRLPKASTTSKDSVTKIVPNQERNSVTSLASTNTRGHVYGRPASSPHPSQPLLPPQIPSNVYSRNTSSSSFDSIQSGTSSNNSMGLNDKIQLLNFHKFSDNDYGEYSDAYEDESFDEIEDNYDNEDLDFNTQFSDDYIGNFRYEDLNSNLELEQHILQPVQEVASPKSTHYEDKQPQQKNHNEEAIIGQPRASIQIPIRKPPPNFLVRSTDDITTLPTDKRSGSPRRKAPPNSDFNYKLKRNSLISLPLSTQSELKTISVSVPSILPQRPTSTTQTSSTQLYYDAPVSEEPYIKGHKKSSSYGFRKNAKKILKKGFKGSSDHHHHDHHNQLTGVIVQKPVQLKTTMRKEKKSKFNEDKPWRNHDDRHFITDQERKRYEGVWASNKGLYMEMTDPNALNPIEDGSSDMSPALWASKLSTNSTDLQKLESNLILNQVVQEIWSRSRLENEILEQIWDLVDSRKDGTLDKKSFIVGMWYVDQCLYGRKLPKSVGDDVWNSVNHMGLNVIIKGKRKK